ncbi:hypothetical protein PNH38_06960 [Anoxybacillus rupiensis]|uniref:Lipoprotein n=1 Tax=Anoxybacteroides rupiense TaxID=311460 RepID=A0ABT5W2S3_9BACL|nr:MULTISPECIES: hypothetical protein [Anoxybacillus]MBS2770860.1 hypothetical protein [Anoxybacillus rupiensis]MDE8563628.1 hypothetical protein [Anoxybacillus rupiensis]QHC04412.1 hypothetical protein GRQ40_10880 [Anoxybacillus sp. PDR2]
MKNKKWLALLFVFLLGACSDKEPSGPEARAGGSKTRETVVDSEQTNQQDVQNGHITNQNENTQTNPSLTPDELKKQLQLSMTKEAVDALLKVQAVRVVDSEGSGVIMRRYDIGFPKTYQFQATKGSSGMELNEIDVDGVKTYNGIVVFATYDNKNEAQRYSIVYLEPGKIYHYIHNPDYEKTEMIQ